MIKTFSLLLEHFPGVTGECHESWCASLADSRQVIRDSIIKTLPGLKAEDLKCLRDLSEPPRPQEWCVSISHTHTLGGWMAVPRPAQIGFDMEMKTRVRLQIIERVCSAREIGEAPMSEYLWCAKEAYYKSLEDEQPLTIPELTIAGWKSESEGVWTWEGLGPRNGAGVLVDLGEEWMMAACGLSGPLAKF